MTALMISGALLTYDSISALTGEAVMTREASVYAAACRSLDGETRRQAYERAAAYNAALSQKRQTEAYAYQGEDATDAAYEEALSAAGVMAFLEIPSLDLRLPVVHGTRSGDLLRAVGHFYGTSLPVGGPSTHCCLAGHSALADERLFTDLTELEEGDIFRIHVLGEVLTYRVASVRVVLPEAADSYLQIKEGQDLVTLYTCTPYAVNTHRLLVCGVRAETANGDAPGPADTAAKSGGGTMLTDAAADVVLTQIGAAAGIVLASCIAAGLTGGKKENYDTTDENRADGGSRRTGPYSLYPYTAVSESGGDGRGDIDDRLLP